MNYFKLNCFITGQDDDFVQVDEMPNCCGAVVLGEFGGGEEWDTDEDQVSETKIRSRILSRLGVLKRTGVNLVVATTMENQPRAAEVMSEIGFYTSAPFKQNNRKDERTMQCWFLPLCEYTMHKKAR